ncbi:MAG: formate dehydrogenase subunit gamma [Thiotrichales bacterium]|nr:MAG: formate dehydrogenase subunit gamma [Thiotrichales bacterium]
MATENRNKSGRIRKIVLFCVFSLLFVVTVPLIPYAIDAYAVAGNKASVEKVAALEHPAINLWNDVRQRNGRTQGLTQVQGVDSGVLINKAGEDWRRFRIEQLVPYGAWFMGGIFGAIVVYYLLKGTQMMPGGSTGVRIPRTSLNQRTAHWFTAGVFWLLAVTGLILLYGRFVLIPILGPEGFAATASACKEMHNLFGPLFVLAVVAMFVLFIKGNMFNFGDLKWFAKGGGMFGGHVSAGKFNAGEKTWFWLVMIFGTALCVSGLILVVAALGFGRETLSLSHMVHGISAVLLIAVSFGHIYLGTIGVEGTLDSMTTGSVDAAWAKAHHDQWYAEMTNDSDAVEAADQEQDSGLVEGGVAKPEAGT